MSEGKGIDLIDVIDIIGDFKRPLIEGQAILDANHIITCGIVSRSEKVVMLQALCLQTSNLKGLLHQIKVEIKFINNNKQFSCNCTCKAGSFGKCKHIIATLRFSASHRKFGKIKHNGCKAKWGKLKLKLKFFGKFCDEYWKARTSLESWYITEADENQKSIVRDSDTDVGIVWNQEPPVAVPNELAFSKHLPSDKKKRSNKNKLYLRRVACLGKNGEIAKTVCCSDDHPKPWTILLPMKYEVECHKPNCQPICYSEIKKLRRKKKLKNKSIKNYFDYDGTNNKKQEQKHAKFCPDEKSISSPTVAVPELILELIDLCNFLNDSKLIKFDKLKTFCKMKNMNLEDFLDHVNYKGRSNYKLQKNNSEIDMEDDLDYNPISYDEMSTERTVSGVMQTVFDHLYTDENEPVAITETKRAETSAIAGKNNTTVAIPHAILHNQSTPLNSLNFKNNEVSYSELGTTKICAEVGLGSFEDNMFHFSSPSQNFNLRLGVTEDIMTSNGCNKDNDEYDDIIQTSSTKVTEVQDKCCCNCVTKKKQGGKGTHSGKKKLKKILQLLFHGPRPTFAKTKCVTLKTVKPSKVKSIVRSYNPMESIKHYVDYIDDKCASMYKSYKQAQWEYETNITYDTRQSSIAFKLEFDQLLRSVKKELSIFSNAPLNDMYLERQIKLLSLPGMDSLSEKKSDEFEQVLYTMETIYSSAVVGKYNLVSEKVALNPGIAHIMAHSDDPNEQKYYWIEWRKATGKHVRSLFEHYVSLIQLAAKRNGFHDASEMWTRQYESDDFIDMLSVYWEGIKPLYLQLHAYVRHKLHGLYGEVAGANEYGKIPAHLTGDVWSKNWKNLYSKVKPYNLKDYMTQPLKKKMTPQRITRDVENLFVCMGFTKLPNEFWSNSIFTKDKNKLILCEPSAWDMGDGQDYRIKLCAEHKMEDLFNIHNLVTLIEYYKEYRGLPYAFRNAANPGFSEAIGETMVLSAHTKDHLKYFGIRTKQSEKADINKLMRIALEKVAFIPYSYILILWRHKVFTGEINVTNYNSEWWNLRSEYQGIYPPVKRTENDFDVGCKQHIVANQPYIKYFLSTILQFQFYEALCKKSDFHGPLHKCNVMSSENAGKTLRAAMSMGSSHHWKDVLEVLTGTRKIESRHLMRYFEPLMEWLQQHNKKKNVHIGWEE